MYSAPIPHIRRGEPIRADWLNKIVDAVPRQVVGSNHIAVNRAAGNIGFVNIQRRLYMREFAALITNFNEVAANRWEYAWHEAWRATDSSIAMFIPRLSGRSSIIGSNEFAFKALNDWEANNDGIGVEGLGVNVDGTPGVTITMLPIPVGTTVMLSRAKAANGVWYYRFAAPNAYQVSCGEPPGEVIGPSMVEWAETDA